MNIAVTDPKTGETCTLEHLQPFNVVYSIRVDANPVDVTLRVHFSHHCYTRSRNPEDSDDAVLFTEKKRKGAVKDERVFCRKRWEFSKSLPSVIKELHSKGCYPGGSKEMFYRHEEPPISNPQHGWYICTRLGASEQYKNLTMSVRSAHWRTNKPADIRSGTKRFYAILAQFYAEEKKKRGWL